MTGNGLENFNLAWNDFYYIHFILECQIKFLEIPGHQPKIHKPRKPLIKSVIRPAFPIRFHPAFVIYAILKIYFLARSTHYVPFIGQTLYSAFPQGGAKFHHRHIRPDRLGDRYCGNNSPRRKPQYKT
jgi:hypothetical protein